LSYLAKRHAYLLTEEDALELFSILENRVGSTSEACRRCHIQRKTRYDWERGKSIKPNTKYKVLKGLIENIPEETFNFLLNKAKDSAVEILSLNLSNIYTHMLGERIDRRLFAEDLKKIQDLKNRNAGLVWELGEEVDEMMSQIEEKASLLNVSMPLDNIDIFKPSQIMEILPSIIDEISRRGFNEYSQIAKSLKIPEMIVQIISNSTKSLIVPQHLSVTTEPPIPLGFEELQSIPSASTTQLQSIPNLVK
jgi:hypothetical protein